MKVKHWLKAWFGIFLLLCIIAFLIVGFLLFKGVPLRFSSSISYDAKLNFLHNSGVLQDMDGVVIGSSMALNNIDSDTLEKRTGLSHVVNLSSWGLQSSEVFQLIKLVDLSKVKYVVYATQYYDFKTYRLKNIDEKAVRDYLYGGWSIKPYLKTLSTIPDKYSEYLNYSSEYLNKNKYKYLRFDAHGDVNLTFGGQYVNQARWSKVYPYNLKSDNRCYENLRELGVYLKQKGIKLVVITTPFRESLLRNNLQLRTHFEGYVKKLESLAKEGLFAYINAHQKLSLDDTYFVDKAHLNKRGAVKVAGIIQPKK